MKGWREGRVHQERDPPAAQRAHVGPSQAPRLPCRRVECDLDADPQTQVSALQNGELRHDANRRDGLAALIATDITSSCSD